MPYLDSVLARVYFYTTRMKLLRNPSPLREAVKMRVWFARQGHLIFGRWGQSGFSRKAVSGRHSRINVTAKRHLVRRTAVNMGHALRQRQRVTMEIAVLSVTWRRVILRAINAPRRPEMGGVFETRLVDPCSEPVKSPQYVERRNKYFCFRQHCLALPDTASTASIIRHRNC